MMTFLLQNIIEALQKDWYGISLQVLTIIIGLFDAWLLSKKGLEKWGYLVCFVTLPLWVLLEYHYKEYLYLALNPFYFYLWGKGAWVHWNNKNENGKKS